MISSPSSMKPRFSPLGNAIGSLPRGEFEEASPARSLRAGDRPGADEIAGLEVAAVAGVVCHHLRHGPIDRRERTLREAQRCSPGFPHRRARKIGLKRDVEAAMGAVLRIVEIRQRRRIVGGPRRRRDTERRQRLLRHHPGRYGRGEILAQERPERLVFPALDIARRPVIEQQKPKMCSAALAMGTVSPNRLGTPM